MRLILPLIAFIGTLSLSTAIDSGNSVSCGHHQANTCSECPQGHGARWCNGDCVWKSGGCVANSVSCGQHQAHTCAECPAGHGARWCNGDCVWASGSCVATELKCPRLSLITWRCGPKYGGRCNKNLAEGALYCNIQNGWCGNTMKHVNAQASDEYDWEPSKETCKV